MSLNAQHSKCPHDFAKHAQSVIQICPKSSVYRLCVQRVQLWQSADIFGWIMTKSSKEALTTFSSKGMLNRLLKYVPMLWLSIMTLACTNAVIGRRTVINHYRALQQALTTSRTTGNSPKTGVSANLENSF